MRKFLVTIAAMTVIVASGVRGAEAATILFDNQAAHPGGLIAASPAGVTITAGVIDQVVRQSPSPLVAFPVTGGPTASCGTPAPAGGGSTFGCLFLQTGALVSSSGDTFSFASTGPGAGILIHGTANGAVDTVLYLGLWDPNTTVDLKFDRAGGVLTGTGTLQGVLGLGALNPTLAAALGVNPSVLSGTDQNSFVSFQFGVAGAPAGTGLLTTNAIQLITAETVQVPIPEPGLMMLLGTGLFGVASAARRRFNKSRSA